MQRKYKTGVIRIFFAMTTATKTAAHINARCVSGSIRSTPGPLRLANLDQF